MPLPFLIVNMPFLLAGYIIKGIYFAKKKLGLAYLKGIKEALEMLPQIEKVPFQWEHFGNYLVIELELWIHTWKIRREKYEKNHKNSLF